MCCDSDKAELEGELNKWRRILFRKIRRGQSFQTPKQIALKRKKQPQNTHIEFWGLERFTD